MISKKSLRLEICLHRWELQVLSQRIQIISRGHHGSWLNKWFIFHSTNNLTKLLTKNHEKTAEIKVFKHCLNDFQKPKLNQWKRWGNNSTKSDFFWLTEDGEKIPITHENYVEYVLNYVEQTNLKYIEGKQNNIAHISDLWEEWFSKYEMEKNDSYHDWCAGHNMYIICYRNQS